MGCGLRPWKPWHLVLPFSPREGRKGGRREEMTGSSTGMPASQRSALSTLPGAMRAGVCARPCTRPGRGEDGALSMANMTGPGAPTPGPKEGPQCQMRITVAE